jgi:diaminohydroxyphosphoribosylaminopyrimidine deaminase / 5-amino-6-(5-phosphoribosylamino)uracil reductase
MDHKLYMQRALDLAKRGQGSVHPNPMVGAVIVKDGEIIGEGYHEIYGGPHAEINAFTNATKSVTGATMYVTLEPCSHHGKTPPCSDAIIAKGIQHVVIAMQDPNPIVSGNGMAKLKEAGIHVQTGVLKKQAKDLNERFIHFIKTKRPFVIAKTAMSKNGKITSSEGPWVTGEASRTDVHQSRSQTKAVMVGIETVLVDNPMLNVRHVEGLHQPIRIVLDSKGRTPMDSKLVQSAGEMATWIYTVQGVESQWKTSMEQHGVRIIELPSTEKRLVLKQVFDHLGSEQVDEVYIEPGRRLLQSLIHEGWINRWIVYQSPRIEAEDQLGFLAYEYDMSKHFHQVSEEQMGQDTKRVYVPKEAT